MTDSFFLSVNKPAGISSRQVVDVVGRAAKQRRCGHAGTLDPLATGVLVIAVGKATRLIEYVQQLPKTYVAGFVLGQVSDTDDVEGEVRDIAVAHPPSAAEVQHAFSRYVGEIQQRPPAYSALKVAGKRAYAMAREGQEVELAERTVVVHHIELLEYSYPRLKLVIDCGSGTYIRSIARDLGEDLQTGGLMDELTRTAVGEFRIEQSCGLDAFESEEWTRYRRPLADGLVALTRADLDETQINQFQKGQRFAIGPVVTTGGQFAAFDATGRLLGIALQESATHARAVKGGFG